MRTLTVVSAHPDRCTWQTTGSLITTYETDLLAAQRKLQRSADGEVMLRAGNWVNESDVAQLLAAIRDADPKRLPTGFLFPREDTGSRTVADAAWFERDRARDAGDYIDDRPQAGEIP